MKKKANKRKAVSYSDFQHYSAVALLSAYITIAAIILILIMSNYSAVYSAVFSNSAVKITRTDIYDTRYNETGEFISIAPGIEILGSHEFDNNIESALILLHACDSSSFSDVNKYITAIYETNGSFAGADISYGSTMMAASSNLTNYLPGNLTDAKIFWYMGAIVHEARHSWQFTQKGIVKNWTARTIEEENALEADAINSQVNAFRECISYVPASEKSQAETITGAFESLKEKIVGSFNDSRAV